MGKLGLSQSEFWSSSLNDISLRIKGFYKIEEERQQAEYERQRFFTTMLLNIHIDKKHRIKSPSELVVFPWEDTQKPSVTPKSEEQKKRDFSKVDAYMRKKWEDGQKGSQRTDRP